MVGSLVFSFKKWNCNWEDCGLFEGSLVRWNTMLVLDPYHPYSEMLLFSRVYTRVLLYTCPTRRVRSRSPWKKFLGCLLSSNLWAHGIGWPVVFSHVNSLIKGMNCNMVCIILHHCKTISMIVWDRLWESEDEVQWVCWRLYPFILMEDIIIKDWQILCGHNPSWVNRIILVSLL